jgi:putative transposase
MAQRGIVLTYETIREWCNKFTSYFAKELKRQNRTKLGSTWHLEEVFQVDSASSKALVFLLRSY